MDEEQTPPDHQPVDPTAQRDDPAAAAPPDEPPPVETDLPPLPPADHRRPPTRRPLSRWEGLERLDRQWEDPTPIGEIARPITALALTTDDDPRGWDYLGALVGSLPEETARACEAWLEAQLAADAVALGRSLRPRVELVPAGRLWYVVRTVDDLIIVIDGPGFLTPVAAAIAASRRYHAELLRMLASLDDTAAALPDHEESTNGPLDDPSAGAEPAVSAPDEPEAAL